MEMRSVAPRERCDGCTRFTRAPDQKSRRMDALAKQATRINDRIATDLGREQHGQLMNLLKQLPHINGNALGFSDDDSSCTSRSNLSSGRNRRKSEVGRK